MTKKSICYDRIFFYLQKNKNIDSFVPRNYFPIFSAFPIYIYVQCKGFWTFSPLAHQRELFLNWCTTNEIFRFLYGIFLYSNFNMCIIGWEPLYHCILLRLVMNVFLVEYCIFCWQWRHYKRIVCTSTEQKDGKNLNNVIIGSQSRDSKNFLSKFCKILLFLL